MSVRFSVPRVAALLRRQGRSALVLLLSTFEAIVSAVYAPSPWNAVGIGIAVAIDGLTLKQISADDRRDLEHQHLMSRTPEAQLHFLAATQAEGNYRDWLIREHFTVTPETYTVACNYCDWKTTDYPQRLHDAPRHLHDAHTEHDPRISPWLRHRLTAWIGRRVTRA